MRIARVSAGIRGPWRGKWAVRRCRAGSACPAAAACVQSTPSCVDAPRTEEAQAAGKWAGALAGTESSVLCPACLWVVLVVEDGHGVLGALRDGGHDLRSSRKERGAGEPGGEVAEHTASMETRGRQPGVACLRLSAAAAPAPRPTACNRAGRCAPAVATLRRP